MIDVSPLVAGDERIADVAAEIDRACREFGFFYIEGHGVDPDKVAATGGGRILTNRPDYERKFNGVELSLIKRLANKWMMRAAFSWNDIPM